MARPAIGGKGTAWQTDEHVMGEEGGRMSGHAASGPSG
jgi:hypothetical protein